MFYKRFLFLGAIEDLNKAVSLSADDKKVAGLAYTQRALILKLKGENDEAIKDLTKAADFGNKFAKREVIKVIRIKMPLQLLNFSFLVRVLNGATVTAEDLSYRTIHVKI